jgi:hypothetical protein
MDGNPSPSFRPEHFTRRKLRFSQKSGDLPIELLPGEQRIRRESDGGRNGIKVLAQLNQFRIGDAPPARRGEALSRKRRHQISPQNNGVLAREGTRNRAGMCEV